MIEKIEKSIDFKATKISVVCILYFSMFLILYQTLFTIVIFERFCNTISRNDTIRLNCEYWQLFYKNIRWSQWYWRIMTTFVWFISNWAIRFCEIELFE